MEATLPHPLERPLSLAREFDLMETWNDYVKDSRLLLAPNIWESFVYAGLWMPFPFPQIDALAKGRGYDLSVVSLKMPPPFKTKHCSFEIGPRDTNTSNCRRTGAF